MKHLTEKEIQNRLDNTRGIFAIEGMEIPKEIDDLSVKTLRGQITVEEAMKTLIFNYREDSKNV